MNRRDRKQNPLAMGSVLPLALPSSLARRLPPPELLKSWQELVGDAVAQRARPVCLEPGKEGAEEAKKGVLVVAVAGAAWRQEVSMRAPRLAESLRRQGFAVASLRLVNAPTPPPQKPQPEPRRLSPEEEAALERQVQGVRDPELRAALLKAIKAQLQAG
jgi:hypothetical protein